MEEVEKAEQAARKTRKELNHLSRISLLGEISASLTHELNQPLTAILANAQVLQHRLSGRHPEDKFTDDVLLDLIVDARRAGEIIERLRVLVQPGSQNLEQIDCKQLIESVLQILHSRMILEQVDFLLECDPELPVLLCDPVQLQQVLLNLLSNAIDAMEDVNPDCRKLKACISCIGSNMAQISITDNGRGLPEDAASSLFKPFFTTKSDGIGMGLAISQTIVKSHGGKLWAERNMDSGATFHITLPVENWIAETPTTEFEDGDQRELTQPDSLKSETVFVVDDDPSVCKAMDRLLSAAGYAVECFRCAEEFEQQITTDRRGCLLLDLHMPGRTGLDLQQDLAARHYRLPIIFLTGAGDATSGVSAMKQGAMEYLIKPIEESVLLETVELAFAEDERCSELHQQHAAAAQKASTLTSREREVMIQVIDGRLNKQIAAELGISEKTVKVHRGRVMYKMGAGSVPDLVHLSEIAENLR